MSNPYTRSSIAVFPAGPAQSPDNITSLANNAAKGLGSITVSPLPASDIIVAPISIKSGASAVSGSVSLFLIVSEDGSAWTGGIDPTSASDQATALTALLAADQNFSPLQTISFSANATTYYFRWFCLSDLLTNMPSYASVLVYNQSGAAFDSTAANHYAKYRTDVYA